MAPEMNNPGNGQQIKMGDNCHKSDQTFSPKIEISERTLSVIAFGLAVAAFVTSFWCMHDASNDRVWYDREISRLVHEVNVRDVLLQDHDALMIREGLKQAGDIPKGPTGNLNYTPRK